MNALYAELQWLPRAPQDFSARLKGLFNSAGPVSRELQSLAQYSLDLNQLTRLAKAIARARGEGKSLDPLVPFRLAMLSNSTIDLIVPALVATAARHGIALQVVQPSYDQVAQEAFAPDSTVNSSKPDAVLFALDYRALPLKLVPGDVEAAAAMVNGAIGCLHALRDGIRANSTAVCIFQSFAPPRKPLLWQPSDRVLPGTLRHTLDSINRELAASDFPARATSCSMWQRWQRMQWVWPIGTIRNCGIWANLPSPMS